MLGDVPLLDVELAARRHAGALAHMSSDVIVFICTRKLRIASRRVYWRMLLHPRHHFRLDFHLKQFTTGCMIGQEPSLKAKLSNQVCSARQTDLVKQLAYATCMSVTALTLNHQNCNLIRFAWRRL